MLISFNSGVSDENKDTTMLKRSYESMIKKTAENPTATTRVSTVKDNNTMSLFGGKLVVDAKAEYKVSKAAPKLTTLLEYMKDDTDQTIPRKRMLSPALIAVDVPTTKIPLSKTNSKITPQTQIGMTSHNPTVKSVRHIVTKNSDGLFKAADLHNLESFIENTGESLMKLDKLREKCSVTKEMVISILWSDLTSNHASTTSKFCTPSAVCNHWNCVCDRQIRALQAEKPVLGAVIFLPEKPGMCYFIPLAPCNEPETANWRPTYCGQYQGFQLPWHCHTNLEDRWILFSQILANDKTKILFNSQLFLLPVLKTYSDQQYIGSSHHRSTVMPTCLFDPKIAGHLLDCETTEQHLELDILVSKFIGASASRPPKPKCDSTNLGIVGRAFLRLFIDLQDIYQMYTVMQGAIVAEGLQRVMYSIEMPVVRLLAEMEMRGVFVSVTELKSLMASVTKAIADIESQAYALAGGQIFNLNSPEQVAGVLYDSLQLPAPTASAKQKHASTSEEDLLRIKHLHPLVSLIMDHRSLSKICNTYLDGILPFLVVPSEPAPDTAGELRRVHASWNQMSVRTGRLSCSRPNLQNIPNRTVTSSIEFTTRSMFVASPGTVFVAADYSQIEMRVLAQVTGDRSLMSLFDSEGDVYRHLAGLIFQKSADLVDDAERERAKVVCLGVVYGMGAAAAAAKLGLEVSEVTKITTSFFSTFRQVKAWLQHTRSEAHKNGSVRTLFGRKRPLPDISSNIAGKRAYAERQAVNTIIQGSASEAIKIAMLSVDRELVNRAAEWRPGDVLPPRLVLQVHDELIYEVPRSQGPVHEDNRIEEFVALLRYMMEVEAARVLGFQVKLVANVAIGDSWGSMTKYVTPALQLHGTK